MATTRLPARPLDRGSVLTTLVGLLACPHCHGALTLRDGVARCDDNHTFDVARQGYLNLLPGNAKPSTADTAAMVAARTTVLSGPLAPLVQHVVDHSVAVTLPEDGCLLDVGAGPGHHLARVLDALPGRRGLALDLSKHAARRAARAHPRLAAVVCDAWGRLPVRDGVAALALSIFAPRNAGELVRVLAPGGALLVVTPTARHLAPLVTALDLLTVDERKDERLARSFAGYFERADGHTFGYDTVMDAGDIAAVVGMGPSARHVEPGVLAGRISALDLPLRVSVEVEVSRYGPVVRSAARNIVP